MTSAAAASSDATRSFPGRRLGLSATRRRFNFGIFEPTLKLVLTSLSPSSIITTRYLSVNSNKSGARVVCQEPNASCHFPRDVPHESHRDRSPSANASRLVGRRPNRPIVDLRVRRLVLLLRRKRLRRPSCGACRGLGSCRPLRRHVVCVPRPRRQAVAVCVGSLRHTRTRKKGRLAEGPSFAS